MTNISPKSKSLFEKMQLAFKKIQKRQIKYKNNQLNSLMNNSINLKNSYKNKNIKSNNDKNKNNHLFKTIGVNKSNSYNNSQFKEQSQTSYINIKIQICLQSLHIVIFFQKKMKKKIKMIKVIPKMDRQ